MKTYRVAVPGDCCCRGKHTGACCPGWLEMADPPEVQACDECGRYADDELAVYAHASECPKGPTCPYSVLCPDCGHTHSHHTARQGAWPGGCGFYGGFDDFDNRWNYCTCKRTYGSLRASTRKGKS